MPDFDVLKEIKGMQGVIEDRGAWKDPSRVVSQAVIYPIRYTLPISFNITTPIAIAFLTTQSDTEEGARLQKDTAIASQKDAVPEARRNENRYKRAKFSNSKVCFWYYDTFESVPDSMKNRKYTRIYSSIPSQCSPAHLSRQKPVYTGRSQTVHMGEKRFASDRVGT
uniref:Uncharacterized protein n=1 Tax=Caenorhabditis tropicalis TaxID=1561998 RepID=A0A1I7TT72_9PELO